MKNKLIILAPLILAILMFAGCAEHKETDDDSTGSETTAADGQDTSAVGDTTDEAVVTDIPPGIETSIIRLEGNGSTATLIVTVTTPAGNDRTTPLPSQTTTEEGKATTTSAQQQASQVSFRDIEFPKQGSIFAHLSIPTSGVSRDVYYGDTSALLRNGLGTSTSGTLPGQLGRTIIAGHNTKDMLRGLETVKTGDVIEIKTTYGDYRYEITKTLIADHDDASAIATPSGEDYLLLYTCYPFDSLYTDERFFVHAKRISGPNLVD